MISRLFSCMLMGAYAVDLDSIRRNCQCCDVFDLDVANVCPIVITPGIPTFVNVRL